MYSLLKPLTCSFRAKNVLRYVLKRQVEHKVSIRGVGRLTTKLPAKKMTKQLRIVQFNVRLGETVRRSTKERVNAKSLGSKMIQPQRGKSDVTIFLPLINHWGGGRKTAVIKRRVFFGCFSFLFFLNPPLPQAHFLP